MFFYNDSIVTEDNIPTPGELFLHQGDRYEANKIIVNILGTLSRLGSYLPGDTIEMIFDDYKPEKRKHFDRVAKMFEEKGWKVYLKVVPGEMRFSIYERP